jgi:Ser/Thr protein kinase RdoA (MazF antagonist)
MTVVGHLHGGHQSTVVRVQRDGEAMAVKLTDRRFVDDAYAARLEVLEAAASIDARIVGPRRIAGSLANDLGGWSAVAYPFVDGRSPSPTDQRDVAVMASSLAALHRTLQRVGRSPRIPRVAALRATDGGSTDRGPDQLLHGDYGTSNVKLTGDGVRVLDFDDAGYGPVEFDVGNSLYMTLFDFTMDGRPEAFTAFRQWFVAGYDGACDDPLDVDQVDAAVALRKRALSRWLDDLPNAPIGIRTASAEWRRQLRHFARS